MSSGENSAAGEQHILSRLSALKPELKINVWMPESVAALENYLRALAETTLKSPLFLHLFHRRSVLPEQTRYETG